MAGWTNLTPSGAALAAGNAYLYESSGALLYQGTSGSAATLVNADGTVPGYTAWTSYTPSLTAATTNPTLGTGSSATASYIQIGKTVFYRGRIVFGTSGTAAGSGNYRISLPVNGKGDGFCDGLVYIQKNSTNANYLAAVIDTASTYFQMYPHGNASAVNPTTPISWTASDEFRWSIMYEAA